MDNYVEKPGDKSLLPSEALIYVGPPRSEPSRTRAIVYGPKVLQIMESENPKDWITYMGDSRKLWVDLSGLHDVKRLKEIGEALGIHPLALEDFANTFHQPKLDDFEDHIIVTLKDLKFDKNTYQLLTNHVGLAIGKNFVLTVSEAGADPFTHVFQRMKFSAGKFGVKSADYLMYRLVDTLVDKYFLALEEMEAIVEDQEENAIENPDWDQAELVYRLKRSNRNLRNSVRPLRDATSFLVRADSHLLAEEHGIYWKDVRDHIVMVVASAEILHENMTALINLYQTNVANRLNEVMKWLTIVATIFIPLTFIAGVYGMNFKYMPELDSRWGYPGIMLLMVSLVAVMAYFFKRKGWW